MILDNTILTQLEKLDISNIEGIRFYPKNDTPFSISLDSIKRIAFYLINNYEKVEFHPGELQEEKDFFIKHYQSHLSETDYALVVDAMTKWVNAGGKVECIYRHTSGYSIILAIIIIILYIPFGFFWFAITGMTFDAPGSEGALSNWIIFGLLNLVPLLMLFFVVKRTLK